MEWQLLVAVANHGQSGNGGGSPIKTKLFCLLVSIYNLPICWHLYKLTIWLLQPAAWTTTQIGVCMQSYNMKRNMFDGPTPPNAAISRTRLGRITSSSHVWDSLTEHSSTLPLYPLITRKTIGLASRCMHSTPF